MDEATIRDVEAAKRGEQAAYARLVQRHQRLVASITLAITADVAASEDAAQEAFLEGWRDLATLDNLASFGPWICQIARHRAYDIVRARKASSGDDALEVAPDPGPGALEALIGEEEEAFVSAALRQLPEDAREAMILFYREGQSVAEVATALGVSEDVVKKRLSRARERIRGKVEAAFGAALLATIPGRDFALDLFSSTASAAANGAGVVANAGATWGPRKALELAMRTAIATAMVAGVVAGTQVIGKRTGVGVVPPPSIRGSIVGAKNVSGFVELDCGAAKTVMPVTNGRFSADDLTPGSCRMTFALADVAVPEPTAVTMRAGERAIFTVKVGTKVRDMFSGGAVPPSVTRSEDSVIPDDAATTTTSGHLSGDDTP